MLKFEKVKQEFYEKAIDDLTEPEFAKYRKSCYNDIKLPRRATTGSAGYDFYAPYQLAIKANTWYVIPLGIKFISDKKNIFLMMMPRSGLGFKYNFQLANTCGIIDYDYQFAQNDGHIMLKFRVNQDIMIDKGQSIIQGIFTTYFVTDDDEALSNERIGGFGSTSVEKVV